MASRFRGARLPRGGHPPKLPQNNIDGGCTMADGQGKVVLLVGASGLTRRLCARCAARRAPDVSRVIAVSRRRARARASAARQPHRAVRAPGGAAAGRQLRRGAVLPRHDAAQAPARSRASAQSTSTACCAFARAARAGRRAPLHGDIERGRRPALAQFLPAHQGGDGAGAGGAGLRVARHPAARRCCSAGAGEMRPLELLAVALHAAAEPAAARSYVRRIAPSPPAPWRRPCSARRARGAAACSATPTPASGALARSGARRPRPQPCPRSRPPARR